MARRGIVITEPRDQKCDRAPLRILFEGIKAVLRRDRSGHNFEPSGNYIYSFSERELDKFLLGMHYTTAAYIGVNDAYAVGVEFVGMDSIDPTDLRLKRRIVRTIRLMDALCALRVIRPMLLTAALFKVPPDPRMAAVLRAAGWRVKHLPENPYQGT